MVGMEWSYKLAIDRGNDEGRGVCGCGRLMRLARVCTYVG